MEFICVLSVGGSLASYQVRKESENNFSAVLRTNSGKREDIPAELKLTKEGTNWNSQPWHDEIVPGITHAIEMSVS